MSLFMTTEERERIRSLIGSNGQMNRLWSGLRERTLRNTREAKLVQSCDTQEWWHLVWERVRDAASVYAIEENPVVGKWLHDRTMELVRLPVDDWIGPWFRRHADPPVGALESAHVTNAVCEAYDLCPGLFTELEKEEILNALREKGMPLCLRFTEPAFGFLYAKIHDPEHAVPPAKGWVNNWYCVIADGYAAAAVILDDKEAIAHAADLYECCCWLFDDDGYGETYQYCNYTALSLSHMYDVLTRGDAALKDRLSVRVIANVVKWWLSGHLYMKKLGGWGGDKLYPRSLNFGDCAAIFRPTGEVLLQVAALYKDADPEIAGLARWFFDTVYADPSLGPDELATFGFFNQFSYVSLLYLPDAAKALSPADAGLPTYQYFKCGTGVIRDSWTDTQTVLGTQVGYDDHHVVSHRHQDQNSFILAHRGERFFADAGHCCYRLDTWKNGCKTIHHNTWDFEDEEGNFYGQKSLNREGPGLNRIVTYPAQEGFDILASDAAQIYGAHFKRAERVWITAFPNVMFMLDRIETDIPMKMSAHFCINNRDNGLNTHIADDFRLVFRRGTAGMKFFTIPQGEEMKMSRRWGFIHDYYHPLANQAGQGKEGSAEIYDYTSKEFSTKHLILYGFAMSEREDVRHWHIKPDEDGSWRIMNPGNKIIWRLRLDPDAEAWFTVTKEC